MLKILSFILCIDYIFILCLSQVKKSGFHPSRKHVGFSPQIYNDSHTEAEWNEKDAWYEALSGKQKGIETLKSWQKVFDVNAFENEFCQNGRYIQATFWKLTKEMITDVRYFTAR